VNSSGWFFRFPDSGLTRGPERSPRRTSDAPLGESEVTGSPAASPFYAPGCITTGRGTEIRLTTPHSYSRENPDYPVPHRRGINSRQCPSSPLLGRQQGLEPSAYGMAEFRRAAITAKSELARLRCGGARFGHVCLDSREPRAGYCFGGAAVGSGTGWRATGDRATRPPIAPTGVYSRERPLWFRAGRVDPPILRLERRASSMRIHGIVGVATRARSSR
jgi:hypothetical protein